MQVLTRAVVVGFLTGAAGFAVIPAAGGAAPAQVDCSRGRCIVTKSSTAGSNAPAQSGGSSTSTRTVTKTRVIPGSAGGSAPRSGGGGGARPAAPVDPRIMTGNAPVWTPEGDQEVMEAINAGASGFTPEVYVPPAQRRTGGGSPSRTVTETETITETTPAPPPRPTRQQWWVAIQEQLKAPAPSIGSAPCSGPGCMGAVGLPVWLWHDPPLQPVTLTVTITGYTVNVVARPTTTTWSMGDGGTVSCQGSGTPYTTSYGVRMSPTCGYRYTRQGDYTLTSTVAWAVTWNGSEAGSDTLTTTSSVPIRIGEYQAITR